MVYTFIPMRILDANMLLLAVMECTLEWELMENKFAKTIQIR